MSEAAVDETDEATHPFEVGNMVHSRGAIPPIHIGRVLAVAGENVYLVAKRTAEGAWTLAKTRVASIIERTPDDDTTTPGLAEVGEALVAREAELVEAERAHERAMLDLRGELAEARTQASTVQLERYKERVREEIIARASEYSWDRDEVNEALDNLGLGRWASQWRVAVNLVARQTAYVYVEAVDLDDAIEQVEGWSVSDMDFDSGEWDVDSDFEIDRYSTEEVDD